MDPQQRLLLEQGYESMHAAQMRAVKMQGSAHGIFVGLELPDWLAVKALLPAAIRWSFLLGDATCVGSGRMSFALGLHGPCKTIDTACASGLSAVHGAVMTVSTDESQYATGLAVSLKLRPHITFMLVGATVSPDGRCKTFDARANGYVRAEAVGAVTVTSSLACPHLMSLPCVVVRHDGRSASLTAPNGAAQRMMLMAAWTVLADTSLFCSQAHGTGTPLGDPTETGALAALHEASTRAGRLLIGTHKGNIGHSESP